MSVPTPLIEIGFSGISTSTWLVLNDPVRGILGQGIAAGGATGEYTDVSQWVRSGSVQRGSTRVDNPLITYEPGTASVVLDNRDRRFDPSNLSGPYVSGGESLVKARRAIRFRATWAGVNYDLFKGFTGNFDVKWDDLSDNDSTSVVPALDAFSIFTRIDRTGGGSVGANEDSGARVDRVLDGMGWSSVDRLVATGDTLLQATTLDGNALDELQLAAVSELGELYMDATGRVTFRNRHALLTDTRSNTPQMIFNDTPGGGEYPYHALSLSTDDSTMANKVKVTREGGTEQTAQDTASITENFEITYSPPKNPLLTSDTEALQMANWILSQAKDPEVRFTEIMVKIHHDPDTLVPVVFARELGDRITVIRNPPGGGDPIEQDSFIRGIKHEFTPSTWEVTFALQSADRGSFFTLNNSILGVLGQNVLAY